MKSHSLVFFIMYAALARGVAASAHVANYAGSVSVLEGTNDAVMARGRLTQIEGKTFAAAPVSAQADQ